MLQYPPFIRTITNRTKPDKGQVGITHAVQKGVRKRILQQLSSVLGNQEKRMSLFPTIECVDPTGTRQD